METLYETESGDFAPASALTPEEAVYAYQRGWLLVVDLGNLSTEARKAVSLAFAGFDVRVERGSARGRRIGDDRSTAIVVEGARS